MIKVYQIALTDAEIDMINSGETSDRIKAYFDRSFEGKFKAENFQYYTHVATVDTASLRRLLSLANTATAPCGCRRFDLPFVDGSLSNADR